MMSYINETDFVIENKKLVYPEIVADGLQLYYDAKGKRDTDYHRDTMLDMSGNKNHGKLHNFAYEKHSGYKDGLVFDYIDDKLVRPALNLQPDDFTFMLNGNIISFSPDGTVKRVQDGEVIESKGFNLIENGNVKSTYTYATSSYINFLKTGEIVGPLNYSNTQSVIPAVSGHNYYVRAIFSKGTVRQRLYFIYEDSSANFNDGILAETDIVSGIITAVKTANANLRLYGSPGEKTKESIMTIDLTETFGAGNEPTKEQMDEIIQRFGFIPNAKDLVDHIEYKGNDLGDMENIIDGLYKTEALPGEEIYTDEAEDNAGVHVDIDGKSVGGGSGKNLLNGANSLMRFSGSGLINTGSRTSLKAGTYTFSVQEIKGMTKWRMYWAVFKNGILVKETSQVATHFYTGGIYYSFNGNMMYLSSSDTSQKSYTIILDDDYEIAWGFSGGDSTETSEMLYPQIELGSTATAYEPPAPTPDYPVEIRSLNNFDVVSSVGKENLFTNTHGPTIGRPSAYNPELVFEEGKWAVSFGSSNNIIVLNPIGSRYHLKEGKEYTFSFYAKATKDIVLKSVYINSNNSGFIPNTDITTEWKRYYFTFIAKGNKETGIHMYPNITTDEINYETFYVADWKLEHGGLSEFSQSHQDITENSNNPLTDKINLLLEEPLRSVGDVKDRLFRDSDGLWKIERNTSETEVLSVSLLYNAGTTETFTTFIFVPPMPSIGYQTSRCSHFINTSGQWDRPTFTHYSDHTSVNNRYFMVENKVLGVDSSDSHSIRLNKINNWLSNESSKGTPVTLVYKSGKPHIEILDQALQDKLNNLRSFEDSNYVYTVLSNEDNYLSENLKPTLHAKFLYNNWYKEDRVINNLMIYNRALTNEEMLQNYKTIKRRWGM